VRFWGEAPAIIPYHVRDDSVTADILRPLSVGRIMTTGKPSFHCPNCNALYQVVKVEAGPKTAYRAINRRACGAPLPPREGKFVVKYFLLRTGGRIQRWRRPNLNRRSKPARGSVSQ
jgi:hypothetical protein